MIDVVIIRTGRRDQTETSGTLTGSNLPATVSIF
jgi:hypothetical protein